MGEIDAVLQLLQLLGGVYKTLTCNTLRPTGYPPRVRTQVRKLHSTKPFEYVGWPPASSDASLKNTINTLEIRQSFTAVGAPFHRKGEIALIKNCEFIGIEDRFGESLPQREYQVKRTGLSEYPSKISVDTRQLLRMQKEWIADDKAIHIVSRTDDPGIFNWFLATERLDDGDFKVTPRVEFGGQSRCVYEGGTVYVPCFIDTQYGCYYNLDEGYKTHAHVLDCAIDIVESEQIYRMDDFFELEPPPSRHTGRVYGLGQTRAKLRSAKGIILTESDRSRRMLPKLDLKHM